MAPAQDGTKSMQAKVKSVLSGDTLVLTHVNDPTKEKILSLAFVSAPRIRKEGDEPFAFESREFLRRACVGKVVHFMILYSIPTGTKRDYGTVAIPNVMDLPVEAVKEGWLKLRDDAGRKDESEMSTQLVETLKLEEARAKADSKGLWAGTGGRVETSHELPDPKAFADEWKGKSMDAVVERVLSGDRMIIRLMTSPQKHIQTMALVAGIRAPSTKRTNVSDGKEIPGEPFGDEAHQFVEQRLLQRNVNVNILGVSPQNQLVCSVIHPNGSIAQFLLKAGLARCVDHHSTLLGSEMGALRQAEKEAKDKKLGVFQGHKLAVRSAAGDQEVVVTKIQTADTIYVRSKTGAEKRISLSSIRQPKPTDPRQAPFQADAKEFLRKKLIGKHVKLQIDGKKPASEGYEEREVATVLQSNKNVALTLVEAGYASVIRHRRDDDDRSPFYDDLLAAEEAAQKDEKGMWSPKPPATKTFVDYSENLQKAKIQSSILTRQKKIPAIVDFVKGASRFTLLIPRENAKLTFVLSGIRAPRSARNQIDKAEPFGQEAHDFANRRCNQRDVEVDIEGVDKVGGFIGSLYINRENFAKLLLEDGLASVHAYSAEQSGNANELFAAEKKAKEARKGLWHDYDPSTEEGAEEEEPTPTNGTNGTVTNDDSIATPPKKDYRDVLVTHIDPITLRLKLQLVGSGTSSLTTLMSTFRSHHANSSNNIPLPTPPKAGEYISAKFSADGTWYRARIRRNDREAQASEIVYIDYGNEEKLPWKSLRPLDPKFNTSVLKPQAVDACLSFLQFPTDKDYLASAADYLSQEIIDRQLVANVDFTDSKDSGLMYITLFDPKVSEGVGESINADVIAEGSAMVPRKLKAWERGREDVLKGLRVKEGEAKEGRRGMWEYGDLTED